MRNHRLHDIHPVIQSEMSDLHYSLIKTHKVPYHSVTVLFRKNDLGGHVIFGNEMDGKITDEIKMSITSRGFTYSVNQP